LQFALRYPEHVRCSLLALAVFITCNGCQKTVCQSEVGDRPNYGSNPCMCDTEQASNPSQLTSCAEVDFKTATSVGRCCVDHNNMCRCVEITCKEGVGSCSCDANPLENGMTFVAACPEVGPACFIGDRCTAPADPGCTTVFGGTLIPRCDLAIMTAMATCGPPGPASPLHSKRVPSCSAR
jgi:hypothetical protein